MRMLASLPGRYGVPALRPAPALSARPQSLDIDSVSNLPALEVLAKRRPVTCPSVPVQPLIMSLFAAVSVYGYRQILYYLY